ncbi:MAG TPA: metallophosphoesterase, partial [Longimicrobium sp.]|nr:metallophosphoesterase [Longimicrobium sp.]
MRSTRRSLLFLSLLALSACGRGEEKEAARRAREAAADSARREADPRAIYGASSAENVRVTPVEIEVPNLPPGWNGTRVAALSDFHLGAWADNERTAAAAVRAAVAARPDLVVLLGDYVGRGDDFAALERVLAPLRGKRVMAVLGHDDEVERPEEPDTFRARTIAALERAGVQVLQNNRGRFARGGDTAYVAGVEPFTARRPDWRRAEIWGGMPSEGTILLLTHMPVTAVTVPEGRFPAILAGHTFCGNVEVPGTPRLSWVNTEIFPNTPDPAHRRIYRVRGSTLFITCGVGYGFVPVRFGYAPEVALITLRGVGGPAAKADSAKAAGT